MPENLVTMGTEAAAVCSRCRCRLRHTPLQLRIPTGAELLIASDLRLCRRCAGSFQRWLTKDSQEASTANTGFHVNTYGRPTWRKPADDRRVFRRAAKRYFTIAALIFVTLYAIMGLVARPVEFIP